MNINDNDRDEFRALDREPVDRPTRRELAADRCPDIMGRDIAPAYDSTCVKCRYSRPGDSGDHRDHAPTFDPEVDPF